MELGEMLVKLKIQRQGYPPKSLWRTGQTWTHNIKLSQIYMLIVGGCVLVG
jgi:hypothetical protein